MDEHINDASIPDEETTPLSEKALDERFNIETLINNYLFGIELVDSAGNPFPKSLIYHHLNSAIQYTATLLDIVITPTEFEEEYDYYYNDFSNWGFLELFKKPAINVESVKLMFGDRQITQIPKEWIQLTKLTALIRMFPTEGAINSLIITQDGSIMQPFFGCNHVPQMWKVKYKAGFEKIPYELYDFIYKQAAVNVLQVWSDLVLGPGMSGESLSIDGLSQSTGTPAFYRWKTYQDDLHTMLNTLKSKYDGIRMIVV